MDTLTDRVTFICRKDPKAFCARWSVHSLPLSERQKHRWHSCPVCVNCDEARRFLQRLNITGSQGRVILIISESVSIARKGERGLAELRRGA